MNQMFASYLGGNQGFGKIRNLKKYLQLLIFALIGFAIMSILGFVLVLFLFFSYILKPMFGPAQEAANEGFTTVESIGSEIEEEFTDSERIDELERRVAELEAELAEEGSEESNGQN